MMYIIAIGLGLALGYTCWSLYLSRKEGSGSNDSCGDGGGTIPDSSLGDSHDGHHGVGGSESGSGGDGGGGAD